MIVLYQPDRGPADFYMEVITIKKVLSLLLAGLIVLSLPAVSFADFKDGLSAYSVASASNAVIFAADDGIMPMSSVGTVTNTISDARILFQLIDSEGKETWSTFVKPSYVNNRWKFYYKAPDDCIICGIHFYINSVAVPFNALPSPAGTYNLSFDFSSDFSFELHPVADFFTVYRPSNASYQTSLLPLAIRYESGDVYIAPTAISLRSSYDNSRVRLHYNLSQGVREYGGSFAINFSLTSDSGASTAGPNSSSGDYDSAISDSVGNISNSVGNMASDIGDMASDMAQAAAELQYISNSQDLIIQGIDNVILHISDQLYAFWDQLFNLIHLPQMDMLGQILQAIKDVNIDVNVDLDELKSSINSMSQALQNKIQSQITNDNKNHKEQISNDNANHEDLVHGYDNTGMDSDKDKLDSAISEYEDAENALLEDATGHITSFEFEDYFTEITGPLSDISYFLQGIFVGLGAFNIPVSFSLALSIALILIGWYRFKGGG